MPRDLDLIIAQVPGGGPGACATPPPARWPRTSGATCRAARSGPPPATAGSGSASGAARNCRRPGRTCWRWRGGPGRSRLAGPRGLPEGRWTGSRSSWPRTCLLRGRRPGRGLPPGADHAHPRPASFPAPGSAPAWRRTRPGSRPWPRHGGGRDTSPWAPTATWRGTPRGPGRAAAGLARRIQARQGGPPPGPVRPRPGRCRPRPASPPPAAGFRPGPPGRPVGTILVEAQEPDPDADQSAGRRCCAFLTQDYPRGRRRQPRRRPGLALALRRGRAGGGLPDRPGPAPDWRRAPWPRPGRLLQAAMARGPRRPGRGASDPDLHHAYFRAARGLAALDLEWGDSAPAVPGRPWSASDQALRLDPGDPGCRTAGWPSRAAGRAWRRPEGQDPGPDLDAGPGVPGHLGPGTLTARPCGPTAC